MRTLSELVNVVIGSQWRKLGGFDCTVARSLESEMRRAASVRKDASPNGGREWGSDDQFSYQKLACSDTLRQESPGDSQDYLDLREPHPEHKKSKPRVKPRETTHPCLGNGRGLARSSECCLS